MRIVFVAPAMRKMRIGTLLLLWGLLWGISAQATHNRAGEITFSRDSLNPLKYNFTIVTYTRIGSTVTADRCDLTLLFSSAGSPQAFFDSILVPRVNGPDNCPSSFFPDARLGEPISPSVKKNIYKGSYTFNGPGDYLASMSDPNRNADIRNIPNSVEMPFFLQTTLVVSPFLGANSSPMLLNPPIDDACYCKKYIHNPGAYDPDGDSLSYSLVPCRGSFGALIDCYFIPSGSSINPTTGDYRWICPGANTSNCNGQSIGGLGEYNISILITEWRNGIRIGSVVRDMQITVQGNCQNDPPVITTLDTCVVAGESVNLSIGATDINADRINLTVTGGPFLFSPNPAVFVQTQDFPGQASGVLSWNTLCANVRRVPYVFSVKAEDNDPFQPLVDFGSVNIRVVGPPPNILTAQPQGTSINLSWAPYSCTNAIRLDLYRKQDSSAYNPTHCETGIPASLGFVRIATFSNLSQTTFTDNNNGQGLLNGYDYCYRMVAIFPDSSVSKASNERCARLKKDVPIITNVTVDSTSASAGKIRVVWSKPTELDQLLPPYEYRLNRYPAGGGSGTQVVGGLGLNDTIVVDSLLDTQTRGWAYSVAFYSQGNLVGNSNKAASIFLSLDGQDRRMELSWTAQVPWTNRRYAIYRTIGNTFPYQFIDSVSTTTYTDTGLVNGRTYCYRIESKGSYTQTGLVNPIFNIGQRACSEPKDKTPPCPPLLGLSPNCQELINRLTFALPKGACASDALQYKLYYAPILRDSLRLLQSFPITDTAFVHLPDSISIAGCYALSAVDSAGNESAFRDTLCADNCPSYELPNVFTPNGDLINDLFRPFPYRSIRSINLTIYDRWGGAVFNTTDPAVRWNGDNSSTGATCDDGVYYYVCTVNEVRLEGIRSRTLKGFIHIFSSKSNGKTN